MKQPQRKPYMDYPEGKLTPARIDESYARIVKCKERLGKIQEGRMAALASQRNRPYARST